MCYQFCIYCIITYINSTLEVLYTHAGDTLLTGRIVLLSLSVEWDASFNQSKGL
jgi:hypothetical protein